MENHSTPSDPRSAHELLADLEADRSAVGTRVGTPTWQMLVGGALVAVFVASPLLGKDVATAVQIGFVAFAIVTSSYQRRRLVRPRGAGPAGVLVMLLVLAFVLLMLSVSYGLVAGDLGPWVVLPALAAGGATLLGVRYHDALVLRRVTGVR